MTLPHWKAGKKAMAWVVAGGILLFGGVAHAQSAREVMTEHEKRMTAEGALQKEKTAWMDEKRALVSRMETLEAENRRLEREKILLSRNKDHLVRGNNEIRRELEEGKRLEEEIDGKVEDIFSRLKVSANEGLPFLREEREKRMAVLEELMGDPDTSASERLRRILEALRIEADYGFASEVSQESIQLDDAEIVVRVLHLGRIALFYQTGSGQVGFYDMAESAWKPLEKSWEARLSRAFDMAERKRAPDLVLLPVGRIAR